MRVKDGDCGPDAQVDAVGVGQGDLLVGRDAVGGAVEVGAVGGAVVEQGPGAVRLGEQLGVLAGDSGVGGWLRQVDLRCGPS